jgi:hypothetical protein
MGTMTMPRLARLGLALFGVGAAGTLAELLLLEHVEGWQQLVPVVLLAAGVVAAMAMAWWPGSATVRTVQALGVLYVVAGVVGTWFHYRGNAEFELEMAPDAAGWPLVREALTGATPALAPGTMIWFGLLALLVTAAAPRPTPATSVE